MSSVSQSISEPVAARMSRLILLGGVGGVVALVAHVAILPSRPALGATQSQFMRLASHHNALFASAWLDGIGSILLILSAVAIAHFAGAGGTFLGRIVQVAGAAVIAMSLVSDALVVTIAQAGTVGDGATIRTAYSLLTAADYVYPFANPFWLSALGAIVLATRVLPRVFGYLALALGAAELVGGLAKLYSDAANNVANHFFLAVLAWVLAASITLAIRPVAARDVAPRYAGAAAEVKGA